MERLLYLIPLAYLAGSVNFAIVVPMVLGREDPRERFSGNPGAFNVYRQWGARWGAPILLLDVGRAALVAGLGLWLLPGQMLPWAGLALIAGNRYPLFHRFKGGKGVGNYLGFTAVVAPLFTLASLAAWVVCYRIWKEAFIGSFAMIAVLAAGTLLACGTAAHSAAGVLATMALIVWGHKRNILDKLRRQDEPGSS